MGVVEMALAELQFYLLGSFQACRDFVPLRESLWRVPGSKPLLQILLHHRTKGVTTAEACQLARLTPDHFPAAVQHLNQVLVDGAVIAAEDERWRIRLGAKCWVDADAFRSHHRAGVRAAGRGEMLPAVLAFQEADALYQGEYLEELHGAWLARPRAELRRLYTEILDRLAEGHAVLARYPDAIGFCHKALVHDPLREAVYQRMMVYSYYLGVPEEAEDAYRQCVTVLAAVGRKPGPETEALREQLQRQPPAEALQRAGLPNENFRRWGRKTAADS